MTNKTQTKRTGRERLEAMIVTDDCPAPDYELRESKFDAGLARSFRESFIEGCNEDIEYFDSEIHSYLTTIGYRNIPKNDLEPREKAIGELKMTLARKKYQKRLANYKTLGDFFRSKQMGTLQAEKKAPDCVSHMLAAFQLNTAPISTKNSIETRIALGKLGLAEPFREEELGEAADLLREHVKYLIEQDINLQLKEYTEEGLGDLENQRDQTYAYVNATRAYNALKHTCKQFSIPVRELDIDWKSFGQYFRAAKPFIAKYENQFTG